MPGKIFYLPKNALLFSENHDFLFPLPLMLSYENTQELSIFFKNNEAFFDTPSLREITRKHQHNNTIKCITGKNVPHKVTAKRSSKRNA